MFFVIFCIRGLGIYMQQQHLHYRDVSQPTQTSKIELFAEIAKSFQLLTTASKKDTMHFLLILRNQSELLIRATLSMYLIFQTFIDSKDFFIINIFQKLMRYIEYANFP